MQSNEFAKDLLILQCTWHSTVTRRPPNPQQKAFILWTLNEYLVGVSGGGNPWQEKGVECLPNVIGASITSTSEVP
jgi:hypothetical protein